MSVAYNALSRFVNKTMNDRARRRYFNVSVRLRCAKLAMQRRGAKPLGT